MGGCLSAVRNRAEELIEEKLAKVRFALPVASPEKRLGLRRVLGQYDEEESSDDWGMDFGAEEYFWAS